MTVLECSRSVVVETGVEEREAEGAVEDEADAEDEDSSDLVTASSSSREKDAMRFDNADGGDILSL